MVGFKNDRSSSMALSILVLMVNICGEISNVCVPQLALIFDELSSKDICGQQWTQWVLRSHLLARRFSQSVNDSDWLSFGCLRAHPVMTCASDQLRSEQSDSSDSSDSSDHSCAARSLSSGLTLTQSKSRISDELLYSDINLTEARVDVIECLHILRQSVEQWSYCLQVITSL